MRESNDIIYTSLGCDTGLLLERPVEPTLFSPELRRASMYALGCHSMKAVKAKLAQPCACHSGKKFRNCCFPKALQEARAAEPTAEPRPLPRGMTHVVGTLDDTADYPMENSVSPSL